MEHIFLKDLLKLHGDESAHFNVFVEVFLVLSLGSVQVLTAQAILELFK